jgi:hypothetical protein
MKETCANCEGTGIIRCQHCGGSKRMLDTSLFDEDCIKCEGTGKAICSICKGTGALPAEVSDPWEEEARGISASEYCDGEQWIELRNLPKWPGENFARASMTFPSQTQFRQKTDRRKSLRAEICLASVLHSFGSVDLSLSMMEEITNESRSTQ